LQKNKKSIFFYRSLFFLACSIFLPIKKITEKLVRSAYVSSSLHYITKKRT